MVSKDIILSTDAPTCGPTLHVLHDPPRTPDSQQIRFKAAYEAKIDGECDFCVEHLVRMVALEAITQNPVPFLEMDRITRHQGLFYVRARALGHRPV